ncbi:MAG TPA: helix-turn-helix transcriptional regulator [Methylocella sp.]|nr:helix-turn-helix transcriptional regulator [Methylocella sp.]
MDPKLVDQIYESAFVPELWPGALDAVAQVAKTRGCSLLITDGNATIWTASINNRAITSSIVNEGWFWRGQITARLVGACHAGFLTEFDVLSPEELDQEPIYRDFFRPQGIGWSVGTAIPIPTGENVCFIMTRRIERGPFERSVIAKLDGLRPHLARSALLSARLQLERARMATDTLAALGLPALVLNAQGKVLAANQLIEALSGYIHWRAQDRISLKDKAADQLLGDAIAAIDTEGDSVRSFPVRDAGVEAMMVAHIIPMRLSARDIFVRCAAALVLTPVALPQAPPVELVQSLFDLTPSEARVARSLASGKTVDDIASDCGTSLNTVRTHVRSVLEKTGCNRQTDVVALLTTISPARLKHST